VKLARSLPGGGTRRLFLTSPRKARRSRCSSRPATSMCWSPCSATRVGSAGGLQSRRDRPCASGQPRVARANDPRTAAPVAAEGRRALCLRVFDLGFRLHPAGVPVRGHEVRPAGLRAQSTRRPARHRRWRFGDHAGRDSRRGDVRRSGAAPPPGIGTGTPQQVGNAVVRARFAVLAPEISGRLAGSAATTAADAIASGQTEKR
jgi:hypothetical protein